MKSINAEKLDGLAKRQEIDMKGEWGVLFFRTKIEINRILGRN